MNATGSEPYNDKVIMNPIDSDPTKFITIDVEACSKVFQGLLRSLEQGDKMFQKFVETRFLKTENIYSPITEQSIEAGIK